MAEFSSIIDLLNLFAILSGLIFGVVEIRRANHARKDEAVLNILNSQIYSENIFILLKIFALPENAAADLISKDKEFEVQAMQISSQIESWGHPGLAAQN